MIDPQLLRQSLENTAIALTRRGFYLDTETLSSLEFERKDVQQIVEQLQASRNARANEIGQAIRNGEDASVLIAESEKINQQLKSKEVDLVRIQTAIHNIAAAIPNILSEDVPDGFSEEENKEISRWGDLPKFDFEPQDHVTIGERLNGLSGSAGAALTGARFTVLQGDVAKLHRALSQFMVNTNVNNGYIEMNVPTIVSDKSLYRTGNLPKFDDNLFKLEHENNWYLVPTAEVTLTNLVADKIVKEGELPLQFCAHSVCYRSEAGSHGRDTRGFIRQHQFEKVELVHIVKPEDSEAAHQQLVKNAENILELLQLPYRKMLLCAGDTGACSKKTYDLEVWLPGQNSYREISSCSNFGDFQARRMGARFRRVGQKKLELVHTLNGSGLAVGRTLVAVLENYQQADGRVQVPDVLVGFMGKSYIEPAVFKL